MSWQDHLADLARLVPPPDSPFRAPADWATFESENGFRPPADYRALLDAYGAGTFDAPLGGLTIAQPVHPQRTFLEGNRWARDNLRGLQRRFPTLEPPWPVYPEPGGFLPFASDDTSWTVGWLTHGSADAWTVAIDGGRDGWWTELPYGAAELAARWAGEKDVLDRVKEITRRIDELRMEAERAERNAELQRVAEIRFGASSDSASLSERPSEWVKERVSPAKLRSFGASGDADTPLHAELTLGYRPEDESLVIAAMRALATELGTRVVAAYALDESPIWEELTAP